MVKVTKARMRHWRHNGGGYTRITRKILCKGLEKGWRGANWKTRCIGNTVSDEDAQKILDSIHVCNQSRKPKINDNVKNHYVYLIKCESFFKIGKTRNINSRIKEMQTGNPYKFEVIGLFELPSNAKCHVAERFLHGVFSSNRVRGEWFDLNISDIDRLFSIVCNSKTANCVKDRRACVLP